MAVEGQLATSRKREFAAGALPPGQPIFRESGGLRPTEEADSPSPGLVQMADRGPTSARPVDVDPWARLGGLLPDPAERDERDLLLLQPAVPRIVRFGLRQHEPVHEAPRVQVLVHRHALDAD